MVEIFVKYKSRLVSLEVPRSATAAEVYAAVRAELGLESVKLMSKGKRIIDDELTSAESLQGKKLFAMGTTAADVHEVKTKKSDPTLRSFEAETAREAKRRLEVSGLRQHAEYKFCRFVVVEGFSSPHYFEAEKLLKSLAEEVSFLLVKYELTVGTLQEMDPENDALLKKKQADCSLLGYNENGGKAIYLLLRRPDGSFRDRDDLIKTLLHELCHNKVGPHNTAFYALYASLRESYLSKKQHTQAHIVTLQDDTRSSEQVVRDELRSESGNTAISQNERASAAAIAQIIDHLPEQPAIQDNSSLSQDQRQEDRRRRAEAAERRVYSNTSSSKQNNNNNNN